MPIREKQAFSGACLTKKDLFCHFQQDVLYCFRCHTQSGNGKGVFHMCDIAASILVAVVGGVICHYIIKWLDSDDNDD